MLILALCYLTHDASIGSESHIEWVLRLPAFAFNPWKDKADSCLEVGIAEITLHLYDVLPSGSAYPLLYQVHERVTFLIQSISRISVDRHGFPPIRLPVSGCRGKPFNWNWKIDLLLLCASLGIVAPNAFPALPHTFDGIYLAKDSTDNLCKLARQLNSSPLFINSLTARSLFGLLQSLELIIDRPVTPPNSASSSTVVSPASAERN